MSQTFEIGERVRNRATGRTGTITNVGPGEWLKVHWEFWNHSALTLPGLIEAAEPETPERNLNDLILDQLQHDRGMRFEVHYRGIVCEVYPADPDEDYWWTGYGVSPLTALEDAITPPQVEPEVSDE